MVVIILHREGAGLGIIAIGVDRAARDLHGRRRSDIHEEGLGNGLAEDVRRRRDRFGLTRAPRLGRHAGVRPDLSAIVGEQRDLIGKPSGEDCRSLLGHPRRAVIVREKRDESRHVRAD